jgi:hypothetical protein
MPARATIVGPLLALAVAFTIAVGAGCASGSDTAATTTVTPTTVATTTPTTKTSTTAKPVPTTTTPAVGYPSRDAAIDHLIAAWRANDRAAAAQGADALSVSNLFTQKPDNFALYGCDTGEFDTSTCNYRNRASGFYAQITAEKTPAGWQVTAVYMTTDG